MCRGGGRSSVPPKKGARSARWSWDCMRAFQSLLRRPAPDGRVGTIANKKALGWGPGLHLALQAWQSLSPDLLLARQALQGAAGSAGAWLSLLSEVVISL